MPERRAILHVDMDAFFAAIAVLDDPSLKGKAVLTGGTGPRGVVTTASYEARKFGCRSAMPMARALRLCPHAICVKVPGKRIRETSNRLMAILEQHTPLVQPLSCDEAFLDVTGSQRLLGNPVDLARRLKARIHHELGLTASIGVSFNKFLAKLASDMDKPDGLTVITPEDLDRILPPLPVDRLWGVGPKSAHKLHRLGFHTVADLRQHTQPGLARRFGDLGGHLFRLAHGIDDRPVVPDRQAKSIGQERTFPEDLADPRAVRAVMLTQAQQVGYRLRRQGVLARGVTVKIRFGDFQTITRSGTLDAATDRTDVLHRRALGLFDAWAEHDFQPVRLIGTTATPLTTPDTQLGLFTDPADTRRRRLDRALDQITDRFGPRTVHRGGEMVDG